MNDASKDDVELDPRLLKLTCKPSSKLQLSSSSLDDSFSSRGERVALSGIPLKSQPINKKEARQKSRISWFFVACVASGLFVVQMSRTAVSYTSQQVVYMQNNRQTLEELMGKAETELNKLKRELDAVDKMLQVTTGMDSQQQMKVANLRALTEMKKLQQRVDKHTSKALTLKQRVQKDSIEEVRRIYGKAPIHVLFVLVFPDGRPGPDKFVVELAPTELMPHSIQTFLAMVTNHLWDNCSFILNALQVIKAAPLPYDRTSAKDKARQFSDANLETVAFKEYSPEYPHQPYTIAFAADGSPSFYINTADNTELHIGDPCFGRIIWGIDTIQRLEACPTLNGVWFKERVGIMTVHVMSDLEKEAMLQNEGKSLLRASKR
ncbi:hypothetical protein FisN_3Hh577 [Fistulifera solaris]|uniref:PPIase cyclophilin-type domain-containing protein n=1 Tax=Fistulifera solaris TaxID=1519565 RepID=A0A1Z5K2U5_FISSO|nr:hypothetical protein FisN_3Hh577 [Fistulifera solaris]|eukprot:GAX20573.1 hypothetical protein FisN_3Hh577 [Fistulifera solaris]